MFSQAEKCCLFGVFVVSLAIATNYQDSGNCSSLTAGNFPFSDLLEIAMSLLNACVNHHCANAHNRTEPLCYTVAEFLVPYCGSTAPTVNFGSGIA
jgi:hypothetical protein